MSLTVKQNLFHNDSTTITVVICNGDAVSVQHLQPLLNAAVVDRALGIAASYKKNCQLSSIAFATRSQVLVVNMSSTTRHTVKDTRRLVTRSRTLIQDHLLLNRKFNKYTFMMDQLAVALYLDLSIRIDDGVDMISVSNGGRYSLQALVDAMGGEEHVDKKNVRSLFFKTSDSLQDVALKAWAAYRAATLPDMASRLAPLPRVNTRAIRKAELFAIATIARSAERLEALKPSTVKNDVKKEFVSTKDTMKVTCTRFSTRIRRSTNQDIQIEVKGKETSTSTVFGRAGKISGRSADITIKGPVTGDKVVSVTTIGRADLTHAESARQDAILQTLQHEISVISNPFFQAMWLSVERPLWPSSKRQPRAIHFDKLNPSQRTAVQRILSDEDDDRIVVIQGPPGTGKTSVIVASVISDHRGRCSRNIWIAAQSNVAVKNIAEKFIREDFDQFRILVSKDFHFDWHEHLYEKVEPCLLRSDQYANIKSIVEASRLLLGCKVILCTLSMLSNPSIGEFLRLVPVEMIVLDEASQIECGNYLSILRDFRPTLSKLVFIGDDKQLPPYGQEDIPELRSVFELSHLRRKAVFLDTQYRMPHIIGNFISQNVYEGKLRTIHRFTMSTACLFVDVKGGREAKEGHSWVNMEEVRVVMKLARRYGEQGRSFRIITPYDAQRNRIEKTLKSEKLPWEDKVFNVDSFQGNEDDHIIVSVVRTNGPGFLKNQRRTNVMLTRCKQGMVICSNRSFLLGNASKTLVGRLAASVPQNWIDGNRLLQSGGRL